MFIELHQYFGGERQAGLLAAALGVTAVCCASYLWMTRSPFKAAAWPLAFVALVEIGVGVGLVMRTAPQVQRLEAGLRDAPQPTAASEAQRMIRVNRSFRLIIAVEIVLIAAGVGLAVWFRATNVPWSAVGMGVLLQATVMLLFDLFAEHRAHVYTRWLSTLTS